LAYISRKERVRVLKIAPTETGCCIRVEGQGTIQQSPAARDVAARTFEGDPRASVVFDLSACDYLDSTFLGCLMELYRQFGKGSAPPPRYFIAASSDQRKKLFGPTHLDRLISTMEAPPVPRGPWHDVPEEVMEKKDLMRHVMQCHLALAEVEGPMSGAFLKIAQQIESDLAKA
jgi:anti-anti-sigma factor